MNFALGVGMAARREVIRYFFREIRSYRELETVAGCRFTCPDHGCEFGQARARAAHVYTLDEVSEQRVDLIPRSCRGCVCGIECVFDHEVPGYIPPPKPNLSPEIQAEIEVATEWIVGPMFGRPHGRSPAEIEAQLEKVAKMQRDEERAKSPWWRRPFIG